MDDLYEKIERYLQNELEEEELSAFERQLQEDEQLAAEVRLYRELKTGIAGRGRFENTKEVFQDQVKTLGDEFFAQAKTEPRRIPLFRRPYLITAGLAAAAVLAFLIWQPWQTSLYDQYADHPRLALTERSIDAPVDVAPIEKAFNEGNYSAALSGLETYHQSKPDNPEIQLFLGITYLELSQFERAELLFTQIQQGTSVFRDLGSWYLALTYLRQENLQEARSVLQQIPESSDQYRRARELLGEILE